MNDLEAAYAAKKGDKCVNCNKPATHVCPAQVLGLMCGAPICDESDMCKVHAWKDMKMCVWLGRSGDE